MKIKLNPDQEIVNTIREGLKRTGGYCPCRRERTEATKCCAKSLRIRLPILISRATATVCSITNPCRIKGERCAVEETGCRR